MNILIIFPKLEPHKDFHYVPYSALCVAARLLADGHDVKIQDWRIQYISGKAVRWSDRIYITAYTGYQLSEAYRLAKITKQIYPDTHITLGGPHATIFPQQVLDDLYFDDVWVGYAERGEYDMPWHLIDIKNYINPATERFIYISSYSCPGQCTFCAQKTRRDLVFLPLDKVERDIDNLMALHPFKECVMFDATLLTKPDRALKVGRMMSDHRLKWICDSRADELCRLPVNHLYDLFDSGLRQITIGLESGSENIVKKMNKGILHLHYFELAAKLMSIFDIKMVSGVIFGCPGETPDDLRQTIDYIHKIKSINPNFYISTTFYKPLPDTKMADMCKEYGHQEPQTLAEWAQRGADGHYKYNQFQDAPWIQQPDEYRRIYEEFIQNNKELLV